AFLDECLHMFSVRFIPTFPILHRATFVFRECTHPLLLNAIATGSLYLGPKDSIAKVNDQSQSTLASPQIGPEMLIPCSPHAFPPLGSSWCVNRSVGSLRRVFGVVIIHWLEDYV